MQANPSSNPDFCEWTRVYVPYVSGDVWGGAALHALNPFSEPPTSDHAVRASNWTGYFQGHLIVAEVLMSLRQTAGLASATDVILTGCSAGGIGTIINCDFVADDLQRRRHAHISSSHRVAPLLPRVACRPEAGWFGLPINDYSHYVAHTTAPDLRHLGSSNWTARINPWVMQSPEGKACAADVASGKRVVADCSGQLRGPIQCCAVLPVYFDYIKTPIFVSENTCDQYQAEAQGGMPNTPGIVEAGYIDYLRGILAGSLSTQVIAGARRAQNGLFAPACFRHCMAWNKGPTVGGRNHAQAFGQWYFQRGSEPSMSLDNDTNAAKLVACKGD
eukprot:SAG31_NODE_3924_length_3748_cov_2.446150_3_plen_332_part_00